jgi:hypothetical protein
MFGKLEPSSVNIGCIDYFYGRILIGQIAVQFNKFRLTFNVMRSFDCRFAEVCFAQFEKTWQMIVEIIYLN